MKRWMFGLALIASGAAWADDLPTFYKANPSAPPAVGWTGFYVGANVGYGWRDPTVDFTGNDFAVQNFFNRGVLPSGVAVDTKGYLGGLQGGYSHQYGRWVLGVEADLDAAAIHGSGEAATGVATPSLAAALACLPNVFPCTRDTFQYGVSAEQRLHAFGTLRARTGILFGDRFLVFATGGLAFGEGEFTAAVTNTSGVATTFLSPVSSVTSPLPGCAELCASGTDTRWLIGWTIGGGFEYALDNHWSVKAEYLYYDLGHMSVTFADSRSPLLALSAFTASADFAGHIARIGANFKLY